MKKAAHFICHPDGRSLTNLENLGGGHFRSWAWVISEEQATALVGGYFYLHTSKAKNARIGGKVLSVEVASREWGATKEGFAVTFQAVKEASTVAWRGQNYSMAHKSGLVDADLPHEK